MRKFTAELFGTFALVFAGTGAIITNDVSGGTVTHVGISLTFGLIVLAMIYTFGEVSGAHLNPAVTIGFWFAGRFSAQLVLPYILSQCIGAVLASVCLRLLFPQHPTLGATIPAASAMQSFLFELLLTAILMLVVLSVSTGEKEKGAIAGMTVGSLIALEALFAGPISGASMNPARSLAPALLSSRIETLWIYLTAPIIGALLAIPACQCVKGRECCHFVRKRLEG
jgi:aquaporin Z